MLPRNIFNAGNIILIASSVFSVAVYIWASSFSSELLTIIRLQQVFALTAFSFVYLALVIRPFYSAFKFFPLNKLQSNLQKGFIFFSLYFGLLHGAISFFGQLGGFPGLGFLSDKYLTAIFLSFSALLIILLVSLSHIDFLKGRINLPKGGYLPGLFYTAGILILVHALMLGTHFQDLSASIPEIMIMLAALLLALESLRIDRYLQEKFSVIPKLGPVFTVTLGISIGYFFVTLVPADSPLSLGIHSQHIQLAKQAQQGNIPGAAQNIPGLTGDRTKRFTVDFDYPENIQPGQETELLFKVYDASSGNKISLFQKIYEKTMHLIIVDQDLKFFNHIHPEQTAEGFLIKTAFPKSGNYHIYTDFQPLGAIEQQFAFSLSAGQGSENFSKIPPDTSLTKTFGEYEVTLSFPKPLTASSLSIGGQKLTFTIKDAVSKQPVKTLKPYLASFGHLVMINEDTFDYLHVHPANLTAPKPGENGGPDVSFLPLGLYGPIKPGIYRIFAQFNPDDKLFTADFTVEIK